MNTDPGTNDETRLMRTHWQGLAAIEGHLHQIETSLGVTSEFNSRPDTIHATLEIVIGFVTLDPCTLPRITGTESDS